MSVLEQCPNVCGNRSQQVNIIFAPLAVRSSLLTTEGPNNFPLIKYRNHDDAFYLHPFNQIFESASKRMTHNIRCDQRPAVSSKPFGNRREFVHFRTLVDPGNSGRAPFSAKFFPVGVRKKHRRTSVDVQHRREPFDNHVDRLTRITGLLHRQQKAIHDCFSLRLGLHGGEQPGISDCFRGLSGEYFQHPNILGAKAAWLVRHIDKSNQAALYHHWQTQH